MPRKFWLCLLLALQCGQTGAEAADAPYLFDVLKRPAYRRTWDALLAKNKPIPPWLARFSKTYDGVTAPAETVTVEGVPYQAFNVCKPHDCEAYALEIYFTPDGARAYAALLDPASSDLRYLGSPSPAMAAALSRALK